MQPILFILAALALILSPAAAMEQYTNSTILGANITASCDCWQAITHISATGWNYDYIGYGSTESEAIADLVQILKDELEARKDDRLGLAIDIEGEA